MVIGATDLRLEVYYADLDSRLSIDQNGNIAVTLDTTQEFLADDRWQCTIGDSGTYSFRLSGDGQTLTLAAVQDACRVRASILSGDWSRWPCPNPDSLCGSELTPGAHEATFEGDPATPFNPAISGFAYSVPVGWSSVGGTFLSRRNDPTATFIYVSLDVAAASQRPDCANQVQAGVGSTAAALTSWLAALPGLSSTPPAPITIGGYEGLMVDVSVAPDWVTPCHNSGNWSSDGTPSARFLLTLTQGSGPSSSAGGGRALVGDGHARYIVLDVGNGHNVLIEVAARDTATWNDLVAAAMPVIETFQFSPEAK